MVILAYIGGLFISFVALSVFLLIGIPPVLMKFISTGPRSRPGGSSEEKNVLIIGREISAIHFLEDVLKQHQSGTRVAGFISKSGDGSLNGSLKPLGRPEDLEEILNAYEINEVIIAEDEEDLNHIFSLVERCIKAGKRVRVASGKMEIIREKIKFGSYFDNHCIDLSAPVGYRFTTALKRAEDIIIGSAAFIAFLPLMIIIALLVKTTSRGEIFFRQLRVGKNGSHFKMYKFRTMYSSTGMDDEKRKKMMLEFMKKNKSTGEDKKIVDESRVTKVGRILRRTSLDELPQLINVLKGEMSLVGPRPCVPYEFENYESWQKRRVKVLPGCTGVWQVSGRSSVSFDDSVVLDLYYVHRMSVFLDLKILFKTIPVMLLSKGGR
ncbi:MAG: sugar transferase [Ignavibacteria bacterium]|nr:sugar transferase [Ignavibacteria bacterium]MCU7502366.1 sugar transferase [Ignavibacteria bacterium]MCU7515069.1 sugar transferase [Ignavibacteria bacterium]